MWTINKFFEPIWNSAEHKHVNDIYLCYSSVHTCASVMFLIIEVGNGLSSSNADYLSNGVREKCSVRRAQIYWSWCLVRVALFFFTLMYDHSGSRVNDLRDFSESILEGSDTAGGELDTIGGIWRHTLRGRHDVFLAIRTVTSACVVTWTKTETRTSSAKFKSPQILKRKCCHSYKSFSRACAASDGNLMK